MWFWAKGLNFLELQFAHLQEETNSNQQVGRGFPRRQDLV